MIAPLKLTEWNESEWNDSDAVATSAATSISTSTGTATRTAPPLRLARGLERRVFPRKEVRTQVVGTRLDHTLPALQQPALKLLLNDVSCGGLSALSDTPLAAGEHVSVSVPPTGLSGGWHAYGRVIRCTPSGMGYRVAVEFDPLPAA
jgi:hypothetical protein